MNNAETLLPALKVDLGFTSTAYDARLTVYLRTAQKMIEEEGIKLTDSVQDDQLTIMYAHWLWDKRNTGEGMPRMIRYALNNRLFGEKMHG